MISISTVNDALKSFYLDVLVSQLNNCVSPLYKKFKTTESFITGKEAVKPVCYDLSGSIKALGEYDDLPAAEGNKYINLRADLKNLYGTIEITDKAMRASTNTEGAVVNLLNAEMEGLIASAKHRFSRMLYGDGSGKLATVTEDVNESTTVHVDNAKYLRVGMKITFVYGPNENEGTITSISGNTITLKYTNSIYGGAAVYDNTTWNKEILGLEAIFSKPETLYGVTTADKAWMQPNVTENTGAISDLKIQTAIDAAECASGGRIDFITCSYGVRRAYQEYLETTKRNINPVELEGGYKTISYAGIPIVADMYCPEGAMYLLDTKLFDLHQLCDWRWIEGNDGNVLHQIPGKAAYGATLVKYANLICSLPCGQSKLAGVTEK